MNEETPTWRDPINWGELQPVRRREFTEQLSKLFSKIQELERRLDKKEEYEQHSK